MNKFEVKCMYCGFKNQISFEIIEEAKDYPMIQITCNRCKQVEIID